MIFTGDIALARGDYFSFVGFGELATKPWSLNFEGAILDNEQPPPTWGTYNSENWHDSFKHFHLGPLFLGNNHIHDVPSGINVTQKHLAKRGLKFFGAGQDEASASNTVEVESRGGSFILLGFGWPVIGCKPAAKNASGINRFESQRVLLQARAALEKPGKAKLVVVIHGNYEFEKYPQPGHRKLARDLIDEGVHAVIFHHPHIVSPIERYKGKTIAYSLGNWAFSYGHFFGGRLKFPDSSFPQIALEVSEEGDKVHHAEFEPPNIVRYLRTESVNAHKFSLRPDFEGFDDASYLKWFKKNRIKRRGLPIYHEARDSFSNTCRDYWVKLRQRLIDWAAKKGLKNIRRNY